MSVLIKGATILTQDASRRLLSGDLYVEGTTIAQLSEHPIRVEADYTIDGRHKLVIPGLINTHTHIPMTLLRGYGDDMVLHEWLQQRIWPVEAKLSPATIRWGTALGALEMIASGTTTFLDMYFFEDTIAEVAGKAGLRAYLGFGILDGKTPEYDAARLLPACEAFVTRWSRKGTIAPVVAPHSTYTCGPETLARSLEIAERHDALLHTHCSETRTEIYEVEGRYGVRPLEQLKRSGLLSARMVLAHCGWLTKTEVGDLAAAKASVAHCPVSNFKIGSGAFAPIPEMLAASVPVGLGTDGAASNNSLDMFDTMKFAALGHKQHRWDPTVMPAPTVFDMATVGGACCLQAQETIGSLEVGKRADLAIIDLHKPHLTPRHDLRSHLVYAARGSDVETTIVDGVPLMLDRKFLTLDYEETLEKAQHAAQELIS